MWRGSRGAAMGRKLDPTRKEKRGPGRKARKQRGAEVELARFLPPGKCGLDRPAAAPRRPRPSDRRVSSRRAGDRQEEALQSRQKEVRGRFGGPGCAGRAGPRLIAASSPGVGPRRGDWERSAARRGRVRSEEEEEESGSPQVSEWERVRTGLTGPRPPVLLPPGRCRHRPSLASF